MQQRLSTVEAEGSAAIAKVPKLVEAKLNPQLIIGGVLIAAILAGGGYWFSTKGTPAGASHIATSLTQAPVPVVQAVPAPAPQVAASEVPIAATVAVPLVEPIHVPVAKPKVVASTVKSAVVKKKATEETKHGSQTVSPVQPVVEAPLTKVEIPPPPKPIARSIDDQLNARVTAECAKGFSGLFCREKLRFAVCDGKWSENPPPGQSACKGSSTGTGTK